MAQMEIRLPFVDGDGEPLTLGKLRDFVSACDQAALHDDYPILFLNETHDGDFRGQDVYAGLSAEIPINR